IPEVIEGGFHEGGFFILLGFTSLYILEKFVMVHPCEENHCHVHHIGFSAFVGLSIHNLVDGFVLGSSSLVPSLGSVVLFAILAHKGPSAFSLSSILLYSKYSKSKIWLLNIVFALLIPFGALLSSYFLSGVDREKILLCIAFSAGTFLHVATSDLLPEIHKDEKWKPGNLIALILGITLILLNGHNH
ncbi:ZIP family metal transporter, partial [bacterium]|nr:ZIP family metal transporter [bacterium]